MSTTSAKPLKMSDTALKFGPEWLRALSHGDTPVSPPPSPSLGAPPRYKLAQHRYGREEMLALFDKSVKAPDDLSTAPPLFVEKTQLPLALIQMTDDEMRMWQRGVNSDVVLKLMGRNTGPSVGGGGPSPVSARGRGGSSMDRGRGRGRGMGPSAGAYNRGTSYEDEGGEHGRRDGPPSGYGRGGRPFERSQSSSERVWSERTERNGTDAEWNGSASPRKEFGSARSASGDNWRAREAMRERAEGKEDDDGWRTAGRNDRWGRSGWRSERENDRETAGSSSEKRESWADSPGNAAAAAATERHRSAWDEEGRSPASGFFANKRQGARRPWDENDTLPEWAAEDMQGGGTFDSSGAFRDERWSDEEDADGRKKRVLKRRNHDPGQHAQNGTDAAEPPTAEPPVHEQSAAVDAKEALSEEPPSAHSPAAVQRPATATPPSAIGEAASPVRSPVSTEPVPVRVDEDGLEHAQAVVSTLVAQLVEDEDQPKPTPSPPAAAIAGMDQWFYRDPQGEVQGPFSSAEMTEWFNSGYFTMALSVRRACDERYVQLGELTKMWGRLPFAAGPTIPPLKASDVHPIVAEQEKLQMIQQHLIQQQMFQQQMIQQQHLMRQQAIVAKLSQMEGWSALPPIQQQQIVSQHMANMGPPLGGDPLYQQLRLQMEAQAKLQADMMMQQQQQQQRKDPVHSLMSQLQQPKLHEPVLPEPAKQDPIQALVQQLLGQSKQAAPPAPVAKPAEKPLDPIQSLIQQAQWGAAGQAPGGAPGEAHGPIAPGFHGMTPGAGLVPWPPHPMGFAAGSSLFPAVPADTPVTSVWDLENAKVEEAKRQQMEQQQQQLAELQRREAEEEEKRRKEEEERHHRERELQEQEEERIRRELERKQQQQLQQQHQVEEMRRRELQQQQQQQQQEEKRRREEEKRRRDEEMKQQQLEEERIRREEERMRKEEERAADQQRRQQEALQRLQEQQTIAQAQARAAQQAAQQTAQAQQQQAQQQQQQQQKPATAPVAPWAQQQKQQSSDDSLTIAEIQKLQEEKESRERALAQAQRAEQAVKAAALLKQQEQQAAIKLRWAKQNAPPASNTKSLAEIQAEEAAQLARQKEKEAKEKANHVATLNLVQSSAWGASHSGSAWSSGRTAAAVVAQHPANHANNWKAGSVGFWEDPAPPKAQQKAKPVAVQPAQQQQTAKAAAKPQAKPAANPTAAKSAQQPQQQQQQQSNATAKKSRNNKDEETVKKLFNHTTEKKDSGFSQWCLEYLNKVQAPIDVPTFFNFLKDVESPFEVQDYVRSYLGEGKDAKEFAKQFLEQRSKWRQQQRNAQHEEDNMCIPAKAVNPGQSSDFHEVKSKSKKSKKKMQKVDASLLGFSVTASTDRINVGERDFVEGM